MQNNQANAAVIATGAMAEAISVFYKTSLAQGIPSADANMLTGTWIMVTFKPKESQEERE